MKIQATSSPPPSAPIEELPQELFDRTTGLLDQHGLAQLRSTSRAMRARTRVSFERTQNAARLLASWGETLIASPPPDKAARKAQLAALRGGARHLSQERIDKAIDRRFDRIDMGDWQRDLHRLAVGARLLHGIVPGFMERLAVRSLHALSGTNGLAVGALLNEFADDADATTGADLAQAIAPLIEVTKGASFAGISEVIGVTGLERVHNGESARMSSYRAVAKQAFRPAAFGWALDIATARLTSDVATTATATSADCFQLAMALVIQMKDEAFRGSTAEPLVAAALRKLYAARDTLDRLTANQLEADLRAWKLPEHTAAVMTADELAEWRRHFPGV